MDQEMDELLKRAAEDSNTDEDEEEVTETETVEEPEVSDESDLSNVNFSGFFHERDSKQENDIYEEVKTSFLDYSMSVITSRALPDLRDGLKPVNRRILWSMYKSGYTPDKPHRKSAKTVGEVMGNYHPHGDSSIYEAMVRMAQDFNYRYMLIDGHGNFGNIDGDGAAAMRYTESRLSKMSLELLRDIEKETVEMDWNFDYTLPEPKVLPSRFPNILVNGTMGIAVGMATNIPPHNLGEVIDGCVAYIDNEDITTDELMQYVKGPDFPTGATILGNKGIKQAYETGRGTITIRSKAEIVENGSHNEIVFTEVPYGVNTKELKDRVADLVKNKVIEGISDYHTDLKDGIKITITLKKDANAQVVLNNLYKHTNFQTNFSIIFLMLDNGVPRTLGLKSIISKYIEHQKEVIIRRTQYVLNKALERVHILEGRKIALDHIDEVVRTIRESSDDKEAKDKLMSNFGLDEIQANDILEMRLKKLTGLERSAIEDELKDLNIKIADYRDILSSIQRVLAIIKEELLDIKKKYSDDRRTTIDMSAIDYIEDESLIPEENIMVAVTNNGYIKRIVSDTFKSQNRGGMGIKGMNINDEDFVKHLLTLSTHDYILFFSNKGKVYRLKGYEIPEFNRQSKGIPIINLLQIDKEEKITSLISVNAEEESRYIIFVTKRGIVKKTQVSDFDNIRSSGKIAITLKDDDELISVKKTTGNNIVLLGSSEGKMVKFNENEIRPMGRTASGVRGINLGSGHVCVCGEIVNDDDEILLVTVKGYGKRTNVREFRQTKRGSKGVKALNITEKNGSMTSVCTVQDNMDILIMTNTGITMRMPLQQVSVLGRVTQGVRLIHLKDDQFVATVSLTEIAEKDDNQNSNEQTVLEQN